MIARDSCGAQWTQVASRTGHCCSCHATFHSEEIFRAHRTPQADTLCVDPATLLNKDGTPRFETFTDTAGCEVWRSTKRMSAEAIAKLRHDRYYQP